MDALALAYLLFKQIDTSNLAYIYNMDQQGFQYCVLPDRSLPPVKLKVASKGKNVWAHLSVQMVMEVTNCHFGSLVDLGYNVFFKNINLDSLTFKYRANKKIGWLLLTLKNILDVGSI